MRRALSDGWQMLGLVGVAGVTLGLPGCGGSPGRAGPTFTTSGASHALPPTQPLFLSNAGDAHHAGGTGAGDALGRSMFRARHEIEVAAARARHEERLARAARETSGEVYVAVPTAE